MITPAPIGVIGRQLIEAAERLEREERLLGCRSGGSYYRCIALSPSEFDALAAMLLDRGFFCASSDDGIEVIW